MQQAFNTLILYFGAIILKQWQLNISSSTAPSSVYCFLKASVFYDLLDEINSAHAKLYSLLIHSMSR